jgi:hypothetical protein
VWVVMGLMALGVAAASPARADERLIAKVPFDFVVGRSILPAGSYVVSETTTTGVVSIASADNRHHVLVLTNGDSGRPPAHPELVFKRFEGQNFLARITDGYFIEREVPLTPSIMEREKQVATVATLRVPMVSAR